MIKTIPNIATAQPAEYANVIEILADAFQNDPIVRWLSTNQNFPFFNFQSVIRAFTKTSSILIDETNSVAALYMPPGKKMPSVISLPVVAKGLIKFGLPPLFRGIPLLTQMEKLHYQPDHLYIFAIGNRSAARGQGYGSFMMKHLIGLAGQYPVYLENSNPANKQFYEKFGFNEISAFHAPKHGPIIQTMLREQTV